MEPNKKSKRGCWIALAAVTVIVAAVGIFVVRPFLEQVQQRRQASAAANAEPGQTVAAFIGDLSSAATASGRLLPQREASLALGISGKVEAVFVNVSDKVQAGDVLLQLEAKSLERAIRSAEQSLAIQEANLAELKAGASEEDSAVAEASLQSAKASLQGARAGLASARAGLVSAQSGLTKAELSRDALADADVTGAATLASARAALSSAQAQLAALLEGADVETVEQARLNWEQAKNSLWNAQLERNAANGRPGTPDYVKKQMDIAVANAEIAARVAEIAYKQAQEGATDEAIAAARASVASAEAQVTNAQAQLDDIDDQIAQAEASVTQAEAQVAQAEAGVLQAEAGVLQAEAGVAQAEANLTSLLAGASETKIAIAEAQVAQARIALENAQEDLSRAAQTAPFVGLVTEVYATEGEWASGLAVELVDSGSLEVVLDMDEIDIGAIAVGQPTVVTLEAWPDEELTGKVVAIAPKAKVQSEIVTYEVHLRVEAGDLPVLTGMTANAELITAQRENVLLVPNRAITADRQAGKYYVNLVEGGSIVKTEVTIGLRDRDFTEITGGLNEGDELFIGEIEEGFMFDPREGPPSQMEYFYQ